MKEKSAAARQAHFDGYHTKVLDLTPETIWAAEAEWEAGKPERTGLLSHDGTHVTFRSWYDRTAFTVPAGAITEKRGDAKVDDGNMKGESDDIRPLSRVLPGYDLPAFAAIEQQSGPLHGLFDTLGIPV